VIGAGLPLAGFAFIDFALAVDRAGLPLAGFAVPFPLLDAFATCRVTLDDFAIGSVVASNPR